VSENQNGKTGTMALATAAVAAWLIYDMATATEAPGTTLAVLQYLLLAGMLLGLAGSLVKLISQK
jgi:molybdenum cofactor biosynthesis enzyme